MITASAGPCAAWEPIWPCVDAAITGAAVAQTMVQVATEIMWAKTARQFDECEMTLRPCRDDCWDGQWPFYDRWNEFGRSWPYPYNWAGQWFNLGCGGCPGSCSCTVLWKAKLPALINRIVEIKVDGDIVPTGSYMVYDNQMLIRTDGEAWPICNDLNKADTEVGTWSITLTIGQTVPDLCRLAVGEMATEFIKSCLGQNCRLPSPVQQLVRQGVSMTFLDPNAVFADGKVGLYFCDLAISTYNPAGIPARAQVIDVDQLYPSRQTFP